MKQHPPTISMNIRLPRQLHNDIKILLLDPVTGQARPRGWSQVIEQGMKAWLAQRRSTCLLGEKP